MSYGSLTSQVLGFPHSCNFQGFWFFLKIVNVFFSSCFLSSHWAASQLHSVYNLTYSIGLGLSCYFLTKI